MLEDNNESVSNDELEMDQPNRAPQEGQEGQDFYYEDLDASTDEATTRTDQAADQARDDLADI